MHWNTSKYTCQSIQFILDSFIYGLVLLIVFCRVARPEYTSTVKISKRCTIYEEDGERKLAIRVIDSIPSDVADSVVGAAVSAGIYRCRTVREGVQDAE